MARVRMLIEALCMGAFCALIAMGVLNLLLVAVDLVLRIFKL